VKTKEFLRGVLPGHKPVVRFEDNQGKPMNGFGVPIKKVLFGRRFYGEDVGFRITGGEPRDTGSDVGAAVDDKGCRAEATITRIVIDERAVSTGWHIV